LPLQLKRKIERGHTEKGEPNEAESKTDKANPTTLAKLLADRVDPSVTLSAREAVLFKEALLKTDTLDPMRTKAFIERDEPRTAASNILKAALPTALPKTLRAEPNLAKLVTETELPAESPPVRLRESPIQTFLAIEKALPLRPKLVTDKVLPRCAAPSTDTQRPSSAE
jgi:hypothetical protein